MLGLLWQVRKDSFIMQVPNSSKNQIKWNKLSLFALVHDTQSVVLAYLLLVKKFTATYVMWNFTRIKSSHEIFKLSGWSGLQNQRQKSESVVCGCSSKYVLLKIFTIFTGKHLFWSLFIIKLQAFRPPFFLKIDSNTGALFWILRNL